MGSSVSSRKEPGRRATSYGKFFGRLSVKKKRLIAVVLLKNGWIVQSQEFRRYRNLGNPVASVKRLSEWCADEMIYLDISRTDHYDLRRDDLRDGNRNSLLEIIDDVSKVAFMPLTVGGGIRDISDIQARLERGADKVSVNTAALDCPDFIARAASIFGSQCLVVSVDVRQIDGKYMVMRDGGRNPTDYQVGDWVRLVQAKGAGEILVNSIDRDGMKNGFDIPLLRVVCESVSLPVIACGGAGTWEHFAEAFRETAVDAVAAANIFQHVDQSVYLAKKYLYEKGFPLRRPELSVL